MGQTDLFTATDTGRPDPKERFARLQLIRSKGIGVTGFHRLVAEYGSALEVLSRLPQDRPGFVASPREVIHHELNNGRSCGAELMLWGDPNYPKALKDIPDPPVVLWLLGKTNLLKSSAVALVGARNASSIGLRMAKRLSQEVGQEGLVVVSGLARGTDGAAHEGALESGTIAVVAGGVDVIYPKDNDKLYSAIRTNGLILSEHPPGTQPTARYFPMRNRIISGLSRGVVVVEAALKSGSMITAKNALDQGREVLAVPGHPFDARASGCNMLIRDGATLVRSATDVLETLAPFAPDAPTLQSELSLNIPPPPPERRGLAETAALHQQILSRLGPSPLPEDQLIRDLAQPAATIGPVLIELELDGKISRAAGGMLTKEL